MALIYLDQIPRDWFTIFKEEDDNMRVYFDFEALAIGHTLPDDLKRDVRHVLREKGARKLEDLNAADFIYYCFDQVYVHFNGQYNGQPLEIPSAYIVTL